MSVAQSSVPQNHAALPAHGVWSPVLMPLNADLSIDLERFKQHARWLLDQGCHGLALFGTTSEANSFSVNERKVALEAAISSGFAPESMMVGTGCCALTDSVELTKHAAELGCKKVLMLPPFYYKGMSDEGLYRSFAAVIERVADPQLSLFLYHFPKLSGVPITLGLLNLLQSGFPDTLAGVKDSSGDFSNTQSMLEAYPDLAIFPGSERFLLAGLRGGGAGCITATGNVNPRDIRNVYDAWSANSNDVDSKQDTITTARDALEGFPVIPAMKHLLAKYHDHHGWREVRPPMLTLDDASADALHNALAACNFSLPA